MSSEAKTSRGKPNAQPWPPEKVAAWVNGLVVMLVPIAAILVSLFLPEPEGTVSARVSPLYVVVIREALGLVGLLVPFVLAAALVASRTWVHAGRYVRGQGSGWRGVLEAGAVGLLGALFILGSSIIRSPLRSPPYVVVYGGGTMLIGLLVGVILRTTALLTLKCLRTFRPDSFG